MRNPLQSLISLGVVPSVSFATNSRYYNSPTLSCTGADGQVIPYLAQRFVPQPGAPNYSTIARHTVTQVDRLDLMAATYFGDPLLAWLICDANGAIDPDDVLATPGSVVNITMPQGVPGGTRA